jgi:hypothetical protein
VGSGKTGMDAILFRVALFTEGLSG